MVGQSPTKSSPNNAIMTGNSRHYDVYYRRYANRSGRSEDPGTAARERPHVHGAAGTPAGGVAHHGAQPHRAAPGPPGHHRLYRAHGGRPGARPDPGPGRKSVV